jgi:hypothetical protein
MSTWTIDPVHSSVEFSLDYMGFSTYRAAFRSLEGSLEFDPARPVLLDTHYLGQTMRPFAKKIAAAYLGQRVQISLSILALLQ